MREEKEEALELASGVVFVDVHVQASFGKMEDFDRHMEELKNLVTKALEKKGVLSKIRAELRANIFETIEEQDDDMSADEAADRGLSDILSGCNQQSKALHASPLGKLLADLVCEYLEWCELDHTLKVYLPEGKLPPRYAKRSQLEEELGISSSGSKGMLPSRPLLAEILEAYCKSRVAVQRAGARSVNGNWREHSFKGDMRTVDSAHRSGREDAQGLTPSGYSAKRREGGGGARSMDIEREGYRVIDFRRSLDMERDGRRSMDMDKDGRAKEVERDARRMDMERDVRSPIDEVALMSRGYTNGSMGFKTAGPSFSETNFEGVKSEPDAFPPPLSAAASAPGFHGSLSHSRNSSSEQTPVSALPSTVYEVRSTDFSGADGGPMGRNPEREEAEMLAGGGILVSRGSFSIPAPVGVPTAVPGPVGFPTTSGGFNVNPGSFGAVSAGMIMDGGSFGGSSGMNGAGIAANAGSFGVGISSGSYGAVPIPSSAGAEQVTPQQEAIHRRGSSMQMANEARSRIGNVSAGVTNTEAMEQGEEVQGWGVGLVGASASKKSRETERKKVLWRRHH